MRYLTILGAANVTGQMDAETVAKLEAHDAKR